MPKQLVNIKAAQTCATIGKAGTLQTGTLAPEGGTRVEAPLQEWTRTQ